MKEYKGVTEVLYDVKCGLGGVVPFFMMANEHDMYDPRCCYSFAEKNENKPGDEKCPFLRTRKNIKLCIFSEVFKRVRTQS